MPGSPSFLYRTFFKRESTWIGFILAGAIVAEVATDGITNAVWRAKNSGKSFDDLVAARKLK